MTPDRCQSGSTYNEIIRMPGEIFDRTGSYRLAFANGIAWNLMNDAIAALLVWRARMRQGGGSSRTRTALA